MKYIEGIHRKSKISFPESIDDYITDDNPVRVIDAFVLSLNMNDLGFKNTTPPVHGRPGYNPADLLKLYIYGYMNKITSSRKLEIETSRNIELMWLLRRLQPDFKTIANFRKDNKEAIEKVFRQFISLCKEWDLFGMEVVAVDGSKVRACNAKKNNFSKKSLGRKIKYIDEKIQNYMTQIDENDDQETTNRNPDKKEINERIQQLKERKGIYEKYQQELQDGDENEISTTDSDARLMAVNNNGIDVCYNVQTAVDSKHYLIVDYNVINNPTDHGQLSEMSIRAKEIFEVETLKALADKGYYNGDDLLKCEQENIETYVSKQIFSNSTGERDFYSDRFKYDKENNMYICPAGQVIKCIRKKPIDENTKELVYRNTKACSICEYKEKCTTSKRGRAITRDINQDLLDKVDERTNNNKALYKQRKMIVEHPFGTIKRWWGYSYFLTRGLKSVKTEASLTFLVYNMKRVINILGIREITSRLIGRKSPNNLLNFKIPILFHEESQILIN